MIDTIYDRNYLYVSPEDQEQIEDYPIFIAGCGIGSNIAECALRLGFKNLTIIDGDQIELTNLNRQNYTSTDINSSKTKTLESRLNAINQEANIKAFHEYLDENNINKYLKDTSVVINALDYDTTAPKYLDKMCRQMGIPVLHPYNLGWAGLLTIIDSEGKSLESLSENEMNEVNVIEHAISQLQANGKNIGWLIESLTTYKDMNQNMSPPQLSVGSWLVAAMCTDAIFNLATNRKVKYFPEYYFNTIRGN